VAVKKEVDRRRVENPQQKHRLGGKKKVQRVANQQKTKQIRETKKKAPVMGKGDY